MINSFQERVLAATYFCLRPFARMLLRSGIDYQQFAEAAKNAFVEEAALEQDPKGQTVNVSRIAIKTGLSRKEVARLRDMRKERTAAERDLAGDIQQAGLAARTLQHWHTAPRFLDNKGNPKALDFLGGGVCFAELVKKVGGDVPPGAVRDELIEAGAVTKDSDGRLRAVLRHFVPGAVTEDLLNDLTFFIYPAIEGVVRNTAQVREGHQFLWRASYTDRLQEASVPMLRKIARDRCTQLVENIDDWVSAHEADDVVPDGPVRMQVGVFYFEGPPPLPPYRE